jgi:hypothetical protein
MMTVAQLKTFLSKYPDELEVVITTDDDVSVRRNTSPPKVDNSETQAEKYRSALEAILANEIEEGRESSFTASRARLSLYGPVKES